MYRFVFTTFKLLSITSKTKSFILLVMFHFPIMLHLLNCSPYVKACREEEMRALVTGGVNRGRSWKGDVKIMLLNINKLRSLGYPY